MDWTTESREEEKKLKGIKKLAASFKSKVKRVFSGKQKPTEPTLEEQIERDKKFIRIVHMDDDDMTQADLNFIKKYKKDMGIEGCDNERN